LTEIGNLFPYEPLGFGMGFPRQNPHNAHSGEQAMTELRGRLLLQNAGDLAPEGPAAGWWLFENPLEIVTAAEIGAVGPALERIREGLRRGLFAAGFLAYEASPAFDPAFVVRAGGSGPLLWFGLYEQPTAAPEPAEGSAPAALELNWRPAMAAAPYRERVGRIRELIAAGDTYQVNFTYPLEADWPESPAELFARLYDRGRARYAALVETPDHALVSLSPELFFAQAGDRVVARPMKGTIRRAPWPEADERQAERLRASAKDRAENVMIVDLLRNDLGRIARPGTVRVAGLFDVERYENAWQMTSTIEARTAGDPLDVLAALFPCGSITGAPKVRTMQIIAELETAPRGVYTGAIGWIGPGRRAQFNVAIRTVELRRSEAGRWQAVYGVGGGITWGSEPAAELDETRTKAAVLTPRRPPFALIESLRWTPDEGYWLLERHLRRLRRSADWFGWSCDEAEVRHALAQVERSLSGAAEPMKVRLLLHPTGRIETERQPLGPVAEEVTVTPAGAPVDPRDPFLYHKTTRRGVYEEAAARRGAGVDDVILWNPRGEVTEASVSNVMVRLDGRWLTPPVECGLLAGTLREELLEQGAVAEGIIRLEDLARAEEIVLLNSVRGRRRARLVRHEGEGRG